MRSGLPPMLTLMCVLFSGCITYVHPLYTEDSLVSDPSLVGTWESGPTSMSDETITMTRIAGHGYLATFETRGTTLRRRVWVTSIADNYYLDVSELDSSDLFRLCVNTHDFALMEYAEDKLTIFGVNETQLRKLIASEGLAHTPLKGNRILVTASTAELRDFFEKHTQRIFTAAPAVFLRRPMQGDSRSENDRFPMSAELHRPPSRPWINTRNE